MEELFLFGLVLSLIAEPTVTWNRLKWQEGPCRREDHQHWSVKERRCRWTGNIYGSDEELSGLTTCTGDEFVCSAPFRCISRYNLNTHTDCYFGRTIRTSLPCRQNQFVCNKTRRCLPRWAVSSSFQDCDDFETKDDSDESNGPYNECLEDEFRCPKSGRCIPREWVKDRVYDCPGEISREGRTIDEVGPLPFCRYEFEFRCPDSGQCLRRYRVKDGYRDCRDGSDEKAPLPNCTVTEFRCVSSGRCIPRSWVLDGINNCPKGSDEIEHAAVTCLDGEFMCHDAKRCIPDLYLCDGIQHCKDCSDEIEGCQTPKAWRCPGDQSVCFLQSYACDAYSHCPNYTDTMSFLPGFKCGTIKTEDLEITCAIPQWTLHDDISTCSDNSDLCFSGENFSCAYCGDGTTILAKSQVCDDVADCRDLWDECLCPITTTNNRTEMLCRSICFERDTLPCKNCELGEIFCQEEKKCLRRENLCDGVIDCSISELDEKFCSKKMKLNSIVQDYECEAPPAGLVKLLKIFGAYDILKKFSPEKATKCDGVLECVFFDDECRDDCSEKPPHCDKIPEHRVDVSSLSLSISARTCKDFDPADITGHLSSFLGGKFICNGVKDCKGGEDELNCPGRKQCNGGKVQFLTGERKIVSIDSNRICDLHVDCIDDESDEIGCPEETHFYCEHGLPKFVSRDAFMDGSQDCDDNSDECPSSAFENNAFSSREQMIRIPFLRHFIWVMAFFAIFGNIGVFVETLVLERQSKLSSMSRCNRMLILNLATSDFLMGVALLMIAAKSVMLSGNYCQEEVEWRTSGMCNFTGILVAVSSECSVATLVLLTSFRLYGVSRPLASRHIKLRIVYVSIGIVWLISIFIALFPILPRIRDRAITQALIRPSRYFSSTRITWEEMKRFSTRSIVLGNLTDFDANDLGGWDGVSQLRQISSMKNYAPEIVGYFGYYGTDGVCIPRFFRIQGSAPLHPLSLFVICLNLSSLLYIIFSYAMIYRASSKKVGNLRSNDSRDKKHVSMQKKVTILIATDMFCWAPICIMSILSQLQVPVSNEAYAVAAIILLPINSSLNPIIYSNGLSRIRERLKINARQEKK